MSKVLRPQNVRDDGDNHDDGHKHDDDDDNNDYHYDKTQHPLFIADIVSVPPITSSRA